MAQLPTDAQIRSWIDEGTRLAKGKVETVSSAWEQKVPLDRIVGADPNIRNVLKKRKMTTNLLVVKKLSGRGQVKKFAKKYKLDSKLLNHVYREAQLLRIQGMTPGMAFYLVECRVQSPLHLQSKTPAKLLNCVKAKHQARNLAGVTVTQPEIEKLMTEAKKFTK